MSSQSITAPGIITDKEWIRQSFFKRKAMLGGATAASRKYQSYQWKWSSTSLGGGPALNMPYGNTELADLPEVGIHGQETTGNYYHEATEENLIIGSFQFGVRKFNSMTRFFANAYDMELAYLTNSGSVMSGIGATVGTVLATVYFLPFVVAGGIVSLITRLANFVSGTPYSKFYYIEPRMAMYLSMVSMMVNEAAVMLELIDGVEADDVDYSGEKPALKGSASSSLEGLASPIGRYNEHIMAANGKSIDVYKVVSKYQLYANAYHDALDVVHAQDFGTGEKGRAQYMKALLKQLEVINNNGLKPKQSKYKDEGIVSYFKDFITKVVKGGAAEAAQAAIATVSTPAESPNTQIANKAAADAEDKFKAGKDRESSLFEYFKAELMDGSQFVNFVIEADPVISESFTSQTGEIPLEGTLNAVSDAASQGRMSMANGNLGEGMILSGVEMVTDFLRSGAQAALDVIGFGGAGALMGDARFDLPDVVTGMDASMPAASFTITLTCPNPTPESYLQDIVIPMFALICGAVPRTTGKTTYTIPFGCRFFCQGMHEIKNGAITNLSFSRGEGNIGWSKNRFPNVVKCQVEITNLEKTLHAPIENSLLSKAFGLGFFDEDTAMSDYIAALTSTALSTRYYAIPRIKTAWRKTVLAQDQWLSPEANLRNFTDALPGRVLSSIVAAGAIDV